MPLYVCENCRIVYLADVDDDGQPRPPTCANHVCSQYGHACTPVAQ